jgi:hypothetical protein
MVDIDLELVDENEKQLFEQMMLKVDLKLNTKT